MTTSVLEALAERLLDDGCFMCEDCGHVLEPVRLDTIIIVGHVTCDGNPHREHTEADHQGIPQQILFGRCVNEPSTRTCPDCQGTYESEPCPSYGEESGWVVSDDDIAETRESPT